MTRLQISEKELANLEIQMSEIEKNFGRAAVPIELEQNILNLRNQIKNLEDEENRKARFLSFCEDICLTAGLSKVADGEFRKKELYDQEIKVKYDEDDDPGDLFRVCVCTTADYSIGEISIRYKRAHADQTEDVQRVIFKITEDDFSFNKDAYDRMMSFIKMHASESVSYLREAELRWATIQLRSAFAQQGMTETEWTPAESELNL